ncbi:MAG: hypothetical protein ACFE7E_07435 [Candidatus Hodarchaeota archaeon]
MANIAEKELELSRKRMDRFFRLMYEFPEKKNFYQYYAQYNWLRASDWQIRIWLVQLGNLLEDFNSGIIDKTEVDSQITTIKNQLVQLMSGIQTTGKLASKRRWRVKEYGTMKKWIRAIYGRVARVRKLMKQLDNLVKGF